MLTLPAVQRECLTLIVVFRVLCKGSQLVLFITDLTVSSVAVVYVGVLGSERCNVSPSHIPPGVAAFPLPHKN